MFWVYVFVVAFFVDFVELLACFRRKAPNFVVILVAVGNGYVNNLVVGMLFQKP